jgi:hypothetical protein
LLIAIADQAVLSEKNLTPEQFSEILVDDLEIPGAFVPVIANIIRTQVYCALRPKSREICVILVKKTD